MVQNIADRQADTVLLAGQAVDRATLRGIQSASTKSGVSFQYLLAKAAQESSLDASAQADGSSAAGLFQFTRATWLDMLKRYGGQYGHADVSRQILETPSGRLTVTDDAAEKRILALRNDPELSALMAAEYARDNGASLEAALGHAPDASDLYLAHFLGASGATTLLSAAPGANATTLLPAAAKANPAIFATADGRARTVAEVTALVRGRFQAQMVRYADAAGTAPTASDAAAPAAPTAPSAPSGGGTSLAKLDLRAALGGTGGSPAQLMLLDQLLKVIANDPMVAPEDDKDDGDPVRPLSSGGLKGSDWADAMSRQMQRALPRSEAKRAYSGPAPGPRSLDDNV